MPQCRGLGACSRPRSSCVGPSQLDHGVASHGACDLPPQLRSTSTSLITTMELDKILA